MKREVRAGAEATPRRLRPGARWASWLYALMLCGSVGLLVWRVTDGDGAGQVLVAALLVLSWICLLAANLRARNRQPSS
ncbi:hypothetical protein ACFV6E_31185 [Streptomyces sp. NPDC059785]|uniref:hypothetical protein n=1 Tax=unclassified Streptomyces TaxID=2593676 RepID=UPI0036669FE4